MDDYATLVALDGLSSKPRGDQTFLAGRTGRPFQLSDVARDLARGVIAFGEAEDL